MPVIINGTTGLSGVSTVNLANGSVTQNILANGVGGTGPAFSAYQSSAQTVSANTWTKISFQTEEFDTANCFANSTFTPNVAGYYYITGKIQLGATACPIAVNIYKNGAAVKTVMDTSSNNAGISGAVLIYCNGTTDYLEAYGFITVTQSLSALASGTYFQAFLARAA